jgi:predicted enzyme related to lactoylglutathione lyase
MKTRRREVLAGMAGVVGGVLVPFSFAGAEQTAASQTGAREAVSGIGGVFIRAKDPKALGQWYQDKLGITVVPKSEGDPVWQQEAGPTAFAVFSETSKYFGDASKQWMLNFRVRDLDKMAAQLEADGVPVKVDPTTYPNGRFARIHDPEGNAVELWQPMKAGGGK